MKKEKVLFEFKTQGVFIVIIFLAIFSITSFMIRSELKSINYKVESVENLIDIVRDRIHEIKDAEARVKMMEYETKLAEYIEKYKREPNESVPECINAISLTQEVCSNGDNLASVYVTNGKGRIIV